MFHFLHLKRQRKQPGGQFGRRDAVVRARRRPAGRVAAFLADRCKVVVTLAAVIRVSAQPSISPSVRTAIRRRRARVDFVGGLAVRKPGGGGMSAHRARLTSIAVQSIQGRELADPRTLSRPRLMVAPDAACPRGAADRRAGAHQLQPSERPSAGTQPRVHAGSLSGGMLSVVYRLALLHRLPVAL